MRSHEAIVEPASAALDAAFLPLGPWCHPFCFVDVALVGSVRAFDPVSRWSAWH
jgi:hypothetical protein